MPAASSPYELHNASFTMEPLSDGRAFLFFSDPFTGEPLSPDKPSVSIESQPHLSEGLDYLRQRGSDLTLAILGSPHGDDAVHDMEDLTAVFAGHDALFFEGLGHGQEERDVLWDVSEGKKTTLSDSEAKVFGLYGQRKLAALLLSQKPAFFADIPKDGNEYEQSLLEELREGAKGASDGLRLAAAINLTGTTIVREWYMLASAGKQLRDLDEHAGYKSSAPMLLTGSHHTETLPHKLATLGVRSSLIKPRMQSEGNHELIDIPFDFVQAVAHCAIVTEINQ